MQLNFNQIGRLPIDISRTPYGSEMYRCKVVTAGQKQQFFNYTQPQFRGFKTFRTDYTKDIDGVKSESNLQRTRNALVLLIDANAGKYSKFITLTFAEAQLDRNQAFKKFNQFRQDFQRSFGYPLRYVLVIEHQKKRGAKEGNEGSLHFHLVVFNEKKLPFAQLKKIWGKYGSVDIKKVDSEHNLGVYMAKYLTKEEQELNKKGFTSSANLQKPTIEYLPHNYVPHEISAFSNTYSVYNGSDDLSSQTVCNFAEYRTIQKQPNDIIKLAQIYFGEEKVTTT
jgi:hypothetical protein